MFDHCISVLNEKARGELFKVYVTEALRGIAKQTGCEIRVGYMEFMEKVEHPPEEKDPDDVISRIKSKVEAIK